MFQFKNLTQMDMRLAAKVSLAVTAISVLGIAAAIWISHSTTTPQDEHCAGLAVEMEVVKQQAPDFSESIPNNLEWALFLQQVRDITAQVRQYRCQVDIEGFRKELGFAPASNSAAGGQ